MIDLSKHVRSLLPPLLRNPRMTALMGALLAPLKETAKNFEQAAAEAGYRLYADGSIISLTHHIKRALGVDVKIVNTPGKEVDGDFRVMLNTGGTDPERVRDFVERYKIAGRRFIVQTSSYTAEFFDHQCEQGVITAEFFDHRCEQGVIAAEFINHQCERLEMLYLIADYVDDASETAGVTVSVIGGRNVAGTVRVDGEVYFFNSQGEFRRSPFVVTINQGHNTGTGRSASRPGTPYSTGIEDISPSRDGTYRYIPDDSESPTPTPNP